MPGGGETGSLVRSIDWSKHALGLPETWPTTLKTTLGLVFSSQHPMFVFWGEDLIQFYNDPIIPSLGNGKHPLAMSQNGIKCWPEIWSIIGPQLEQVLHQGLPTWHEDQLVPFYRNGRIEEIYWTYGYSPIREPDGSVSGVFVVCTETTAAVMAKRALLAEREQIHSLFMHASVPICVFEGPDHVFTLANAQYIDYCGRNPLGLRAREAFTEEEAGQFFKILDEVYQTGEPFVGTEMFAALKNPDGSVRECYFDIGYHPARSPDGKITGVIAIVQDVSNHVKARKLLAAGEVKFAVLANSIPQLAWMANADGFTHWYNQNWYDYTGTSPSEMTELGWQSVHDPKVLPDVMKRWASSIATGEPFHMETPLSGKDGTFRWFVTRAVPVRSPDGELTGWIGSNTDIDDQKRLIQDLEEQRALREKFVDSLSHDLRTPMTAGKLTAQLILRRPNDPANVTKLAERIVVNMDRADAMIRDLLDVSRIRAGEPVPLTIKECRMDQIIKSTVDELADVHGNRIRNDNEIGPVTGYWDESAVQRIVENLTGNAIKYGDKTAPVTIRLRATPEWVEFSVHNEGDVIAEPDREVLFNPFLRTKSAIDGMNKGWGIGLTLVKGMTEAQGGTVRVESSEGLGTTFFVRLPKDSRSSL
jgi:PAS domain S-box-containing protein